MITYPETVTGTITPKPVTVTVDQGGEAEYGSEPESFTGSYIDIGDQKQTGVTISVEDPDNVWPEIGEYPLTATIADGNYTVEKVEPETFTITPAALDLKAKTVLVRYGDTAGKTLNTTGIAAIPGSFAVKSVEDTHGILAVEPSGDSLAFSLTEGLEAASIGQTAAVTLTFTPEDSNYAAGEVVVTIELTEKDPIEDITVTMADWVYGDEASEPEATTAVTGGEWSYVYEGDQLDGTKYSASDVKPDLPGTYTVTATYESTVAKGSGSAPFTIAKKPLSYTGVTVKEKAYNGTATAEIEGTLAYDCLLYTSRCV